MMQTKRPSVAPLLSGGGTKPGGRMIVAFDVELADWIRAAAKKTGLLPGEWVRSQIRIQKKASEDPR